MSFNNVIPGSLLNHDSVQVLRIAELEEENEALKSVTIQQGGYISQLERENKVLRAKLDNSKKLSPRDVELIKRFGSTTGLSHQELADSFGVNRATISRTLNGTYHKTVIGE